MTTKSLRVAVTGGTGFVGRHVVPHLLDSGHHVRVLVRNPDRLKSVDNRLTPVKGGLFDDSALSQLCDGVDAVVHLVGIIMEIPSKGQTFERIHAQATRRLVTAAQAAGVKRWVHMSALGARPQDDNPPVSDYHRTKFIAEQAVRNSGIPFTIFRPSLIHGHDGEFMRMVKGFLTGLFPPFVPYFGAGALGTKGAGHLQPVYIEDVAKVFADAVAHDKSVGETYPVGGPDVFTWPGLYETCRKHLPGVKAKKKIVAVPAWYARMIAGLPGVPFNRDQVLMSQEESTCDTAKVCHDFAMTMTPFEESFADYAGKI
ncbi:MAG: NAD(P)H-binding protein [Phycisphaera sp.]|nr:NAD(P)H-binding protein [Phycisphaera sp.]